MCNNKLNNGAEAPNSGGKIGAASPEFGQSPLLPNVQAEPWRGMARMMLLGATVVTVLGIGSSAWFGPVFLYFRGNGSFISDFFKKNINAFSGLLIRIQSFMGLFQNRKAVCACILFPYSLCVASETRESASVNQEKSVNFREAIFIKSNLINSGIKTFNRGESKILHSNQLDNQVIFGGAPAGNVIDKISNESTENGPYKTRCEIIGGNYGHNHGKFFIEFGLGAIAGFVFIILLHQLLFKLPPFTFLRQWF